MQFAATLPVNWTQKESVKANLRRLVKRLLRKYGIHPKSKRKRC
ncbi:type I restriction enzyme endonuclease domain-containing protein [Nostoc punctiforme UO1]